MSICLWGNVREDGFWNGWDGRTVVVAISWSGTPICEMLPGTKPTTGATHMFFFWNNQSSCTRQVVCFKDCKDTYLQYFAIMLSCVQKSSRVLFLSPFCWFSPQLVAAILAIMVVLSALFIGKAWFLLFQITMCSPCLLAITTFVQINICSPFFKFIPKPAKGPWPFFVFHIAAKKHLPLAQRQRRRGVHDQRLQPWKLPIPGLQCIDFRPGGPDTWGPSYGGVGPMFP